MLQRLDLSNWTTPRAKAMNSMFNGCSSLTELIGLNGFVTDIVTMLNSMFLKCGRLEELDLSSFDVKIANNLDYMFQECTDLRVLKPMKNISANLSVKDCSYLTIESLVSIIENLAEVNETKVLTLGELNYAKIKDNVDLILMATNKGWSVVI